VRSLLEYSHLTRYQKRKKKNTHYMKLAFFSWELLPKCHKWIGAVILSKAIINFEIFEKIKSPTNKARVLLLGSIDLDCQTAVGFYFIIYYPNCSIAILMLNPSLDASQWRNTKNLKNKTITLLGMGLLFIMFKKKNSRIFFLKPQWWSSIGRLEN